MKLYLLLWLYPQLRRAITLKKTHKDQRCFLESSDLHNQQELKAQKLKVLGFCNFSYVTFYKVPV